MRQKNNLETFLKTFLDESATFLKEDAPPTKTPEQREQERVEKREAYYKDVTDRTQGKSVSELSQKDLADLVMLDIFNKSSKPEKAMAKPTVYGDNAKELDSEGISAAARERNAAEAVKQREQLRQDLLQASKDPEMTRRPGMRYLAKSAERMLPLEDQPISPFYKISRNEFKKTFGRDYEGASTRNMRALENWKTDLPGRLEKIERNWQDKMSHKAQIDAFNKYMSGKKMNLANLPGAVDAAEKARIESDMANPVHKYDIKYFDSDEYSPLTGEEPKDLNVRSGSIFTNPLDLTGKSVNDRINRR